MMSETQFGVQLTSSKRGGIGLSGAAFNLSKAFLARGVAVEQSHQKGDIVANQKTQNVHQGIILLRRICFSLRGVLRPVFLFMQIKSPRLGRFYFFDAQNNDHSHPMPVHPKIQLARRTNIISCLFLPVWRANHAGASTITAIIKIDIAYFATGKISDSVIIYFIYIRFYFRISF